MESNTQLVKHTAIVEDWERQCPSLSFKMVGYDSFALLVNGEERDNRGETHGSIRWDSDKLDWVVRRRWNKTKWESFRFNSLALAMGSLVMGAKEGFHEGTLKMDRTDQRIVSAS